MELPCLLFVTNINKQALWSFSFMTLQAKQDGKKILKESKRECLSIKYLRVVEYFYFCTYKLNCAQFVKFGTSILKDPEQVPNQGSPQFLLVLAG